MDFEILNWLKRFNFVDYFGLVKHKVKFDHSMWEKEEILANLREGFTSIKCNICDENSTWINFNEKVALCEIHIKAYDESDEHVVKIRRIVRDFKENLEKMEKYLFYIQERYIYFATPKLVAFLSPKNKIKLSESKDLLARKIKDLHDNIKRLMKNRSLDFYHDVKRDYDQLKATVFDVLTLLSTLLNEFKTDSLIKTLKESSRIKHKGIKANEESKGELNDDPQDIFDQKFDIYALDYLSAEKIKQLMENIRNVCKWAEDYYISYTDKEQKHNAYAKQVLDKIRSKIKEAAGIDTTEENLSLLLDNILEDIEKFDSTKHFEQMKVMEEQIKKLCSKSILETLDEKVITEMKEPIIDFLYRLKDKHPSSIPEDHSFDVFHRVMHFMDANKQKPSKVLIEKYRLSKTTQRLNLFPSHEDYKKIKGIWGDNYDDLKKEYSSRPEFIYFFDPDLEIQTKFGSRNCLKCIRIGFFEKGKGELTAAGLEIYRTWLSQGYYKEDKLEYFCRWIGYDGGSYTGGHKQDRWNGKGEEEWGDGRREIAYWVDNSKEGAAKFYDANGNEEDRFYKDGKLVKQ